MTFVLATHNLHKQEELRHILQAQLGRVVEILTLDTIQPPIGDIKETGTTLEENALIKARAVFEQTKIPTVADDTGLEVFALDGAPGVYSARYSGEGATYQSNIQKLLKELGGNPDRRATFVSVIAFIDAKGTEHLFRGEVRGRIGWHARGSNGFGYDPIFIPEDGTKTFAQMTEEEKNAVSHRGRAMGKFVSFLIDRKPISAAAL
ncbi:MAG TPA: RdgB/HAM1 family non-canonical purine NTP pyrophosphatase [Candidatus Kapabacteria bacterium]|jgi:XTP/dITP diphosphohydrolase